MRFILVFSLLFFTSFNLSAQSCTDAEGDFSFVVTPPLPTAGYAPGTVVNMCFTLDGFNNVGANWVHSIIPNFGPGYDVTSIVPGTPPPACINGGTWGWYNPWPACGVALAVTNPGFAFDSNGGVACGGAANDGNPGNNFGDGPAFCPRTFCWDITTVATGLCVNEAFLVGVDVNPDSETGSYGNNQCFDDEPLCWPEIQNVTADINMPCPGEDFILTGSFDAESDCGINVEWILNGNVVGTELTLTTTVEGTYTLLVSSDGCEAVEDMITATYVSTPPTLTPNGIADFCFGETVTLTATGGTSYLYTGPNGQSSNANPFSFPATANDEGTWTVTVFSGATASCSQDLDVFIIVAPELFPMATATPDPVCVGDPVTLTGTGAGAGGAYEWTLPNGSQVLGNPRVYVTESPGVNQVTLTVYDASGNCTEDFTFDFFVNPLPNASATALPGMSCENDPVELFGGGGGTYEWSTGQTGSPITVFPTPPQQTYQVTVTSADGCEDVADVTVIVQRFLDAPIINCEAINPTRLDFDWNSVSGADYYEISISINGGPFNVIESQYFGTTYTLSGLAALTNVEIRIVPFTFDNPNCPGTEGEQSCSTPDCNPVFIFLEDGMTGPYCYDASTNDPIMLAAEINAPDPGRLYWSGPGIFFEDNPADFFPPGPGNYDLTVHFELNDGSCPVEETFTIFVEAAASATIDASDTQTCTDETITVELDGNVNNAATYVWDFGGATVNSGSGNAGPYTLSFPAAGTYTISLMTTLGMCTDMDEVVITVGAEIVAPTVTCQSTTQDEIIFAWNTVPGATGYTVNLISGPAGTVVGNTYVVSGLTFGQQVEISVTAQGTALCAGATSNIQLCEAQSCPEITLMVTTPPQSFCFTNQNDPITLDFTTDNPSNPTDTIWSGPGVVGNTFDPDVAGVGTHQVTVSVTDDNCPFNASVEFVVLALPTSTFDLATEACVDDEVTITYTGDADPNNSTFNWDFDGGTIVSGTEGGPYVISWPTPGAYEVTLALNDGECASMTSPNTINIVAPLPMPVVSCVNPGLDEVTFEWDVDPNADSYQVTVISGPTGVQMGNQYVVTGLAENDQVTIEVVALNSGICGASEPREITCQARSCPPILVEIDNAPASFCMDNTAVNFELVATITGSLIPGNLTWSGPGVIGSTFFVDNANLGANEVIATYAEDGCTYRDTVIFTLFAVPMPSFTIDLTEACVGDEAVLDFTGAMLAAGSSYAWDFDGGNAVPGVGEGPHTVTWDTPGTKTVSLTVTENGCTSEPVTQTINIIEPLPAPALACGGGTVDSVSFSWPPIVGALGYVVTIDGGAPDTITATSIGVGQLAEGQSVTATVYALGAAPCNDGPPITDNCVAEVCPELTVLIDQTDNQLCLGVSDPFSVLGIAQNSGSGTGTYTWGGTNVSNDTFFYAGLPPGDYEVTVAYAEGLCTYRDTATFTVFPQPIANFNLAADTVCLLAENTVTYVGIATAGDTYNWDFDGGVAVPGNGPGPHTVSWDTPGLKEITLSVTEGVCTSPIFVDTVMVIDTLAIPMVMCTGADLNSVSVEWTDVTPNGGYLVFVDGAFADTISGTTYAVTGLLPATEVTISVVAISTGPCANSGAGTATCTSEACPDFTADFSSNPTSFCLDLTQDQSFQLMATVGVGANQTFAWSGPGVTGDIFDPTGAGVGIHTIFLNYSEAGPCPFLDSFDIQVFEIPVASFDISTDLACTDEDVTITFTGTASPGSTFNWTVSNGTMLVGAGPHVISSPTAEMIDVSLNVVSSGCSDAAPIQTINVVAPLAAVELSCTEQQLEQVTFTWPAVPGATQYIVERPGQPSDTVTATTYTVTGLVPEQFTVISVRALGVAPCNDGPADSENCAALACPDITINIDVAAEEFCLTSDVARVAINLSTVGGDMTGSFMLMGNGVVQEGTNFFFDPTVAGVGNHTITIDYTETAGCSASNSFMMDVFAVPSADFTVSDADICSTETTTISYLGTATAQWDFDGGVVVSQVDETYVVSWPTTGTYTVTLNVTENGCVNSSSAEVMVTEPLVNPAPFCDATSITSVTFSWPAVVGATGYQVSIDGATPVTITETTVTVTDLQDEQTVTLTLVALGDDPCGDSDPIEVSCTTDPCFVYTLTPSIDQAEFCIGVQDVQPFELVLGIAGSGPADGTITWSGSGVISDPNNSDGFLFDPMAVAPGEYTLTATYIESICTTTTSLTVDVFATPEVSFNNFASVICETGATTIVLTNGDNSTFPALSWSLDGGTLTEAANNTFSISWAGPGERTVTLDLERNGCTNSYSFPITVERQANAGSQVMELSVCSGSGETFELSELLEGADEGGVWSPGLGSPAIISADGQLPTTNLAAGEYVYLYTIEGNACETSVAEVTVEVQPAPVAVPGTAQDLTCDMGMVSLNGSQSTGAGNLTYLWTGPDGNEGLIMNPTNAMIDVSLPGTYVLTVTSELGCSASASVEVVADTEVPVPQIELSNISCFSADDGVILVSSVQGGRAPYTYSLDGATPVTSGFFSSLQPAEYALRVRDANGCFSDLFLDLSEPEQLSISINIPNDDPNYDLGERVTLSASISGGNVIDTLIWEPDTLNQGTEGNSITFIANETQQIMVTVVDELGCRASDLTTIFVRRDDPIYIPTGISPNGDNINDILYIGADTDRVRIIESFLIFNRWGEAVFQNYDFLPNEPAQGWDGTHRGETLNPEVFVYVAVVIMEDGERVVYKGDITLLR